MIFWRNEKCWSKMCNHRKMQLVFLYWIPHYFVFPLKSCVGQCKKNVRFCVCFRFSPKKSSFLDWMHIHCAIYFFFIKLSFNSIFEICFSLWRRPGNMPGCIFVCFAGNFLRQIGFVFQSFKIGPFSWLPWWNGLVYSKYFNNEKEKEREDLREKIKWQNEIEDKTSTQRRRRRRRNVIVEVSGGKDRGEISKCILDTKSI